MHIRRNEKNKVSKSPSKVDRSVIDDEYRFLFIKLRSSTASLLQTRKTL